MRIRELATIRLLVEAGVLVICAGGGGIPVIVTERGAVVGVEAVIDKDRAASLLARELGAGALLILTDVPAVFSGWGTPQQRAIRKTTPAELGRLQFAPGSMGPKVEAACAFVQATGGVAGIGALADAAPFARRHIVTPTRKEGPLPSPRGERDAGARSLSLGEGRGDPR